MKKKMKEEDIKATATISGISHVWDRFLTDSPLRKDWPKDKNGIPVLGLSCPEFNKSTFPVEFNGGLRCAYCGMPVPVPQELKG